MYKNLHFGGVLINRDGSNGWLFFLIIGPVPLDRLFRKDLFKRGI